MHYYDWKIREVLERVLPDYIADREEIINEVLAELRNT